MRWLDRVLSWLRSVRSKQTPAASPRDFTLLYYTGHDSAYWVEWIQRRIARYFEAEPDNPHPECDPGEWLGDLVEEVMQSRIVRYGDENIQMSLVLATILSTWSLRLARTKAYDPRRPIALRQLALQSFTHSQQTLFDAITNERRDAEFFTLPRWDFPHDPKASNGSFV